MKRLILLAVSVSLFAPHCIAQNNGDSNVVHHHEKFFLSVKLRKPDNNKKFTFGFNYGYGTPIGNFARADESKYPNSRFTKQDTNHLGGYALSGFHFEYFLTYKIVRHLSIMASVCGNDIGYDINTLNSQYIQFFPPNTVAVTTGDSYYILQYLMGPALNLPLGKKFSVEFKALAGYTTSNYPTLAYLGGTESAVYDLQGGSGFGYHVGTGIKFITAEGLIGVHLNIGYAGSIVNYSGYSISYYTPTTTNQITSAQYLGSSIYNVPKSLSVSLLQITFGITGEL